MRQSNAITVDFRVNGKKNDSVLKIHDVDESFIAYLGLKSKTKKVTIKEESDLWAINGKCEELFLKLGEIKKRHFSVGDKTMSVTKMTQKEYSSLRRHISREMCKVCKELCGSRCSFRTFRDLMGVVDDHVYSYWWYCATYFRDEWWNANSIEISWR